MFLDAAQISFARGTLVDRIDVAWHPEHVLPSRVARSDRARQRITRSPAPANRHPPPSFPRPLLCGLWLSGFLPLLVGVFLVYNAVGIAVVQRRREIGCCARSA